MVSPYCTSESAGTFVVQQMVADVDVMAPTLTPEIAGWAPDGAVMYA